MILITEATRQLFARMHSDDEGATAIEYGLIAALVAVAIIAALILLGTNLDGIFRTVAGALGGAGGE